MKRERGLWAALEALPTGAAVLAEWRHELGSEFDMARPFLRPTTRQSKSYPCTHPLPCGCRHRAVPQYRVAVCTCAEADCPRIQVQARDLIVFELDRARFGEAASQVLGFDACSGRPAGGETQALRVGSHGSQQCPVYLVLPYDEAALIREMEAIMAVAPGPFILLTPTELCYSPTVESMQVRHKLLLLPLSRWLGLDSAGRFKLTGAVARVLSDFDCRVYALPGNGLESVSRQIQEGTQAIQTLGRRIEAGFDQVSRERITDALRQKEQRQTIEEMAEGLDRFLAGLQEKLNPKDLELFLAMATRITLDGLHRFRDYAEVGKQMGISKQAAHQRFKALTMRRPEVADYLRTVREAPAPRRFSEMAPSERRRVGIEESYDAGS